VDGATSSHTTEGATIIAQIRTPRRTLAIAFAILGLAGGASGVLAANADARPSDDGEGCYALSGGWACQHP
jgi:hypothetical protein